MSAESLNVLNIRSRIGPRLNSSDIDVSPGVDLVSEKIKTGKVIRGELVKTAERLPEELRNARFVSIMFCADLDNQSFKKLTDISLRIGQYESFVSYFDLSWGFSAVSGPLYFADERKRNKTDVMRAAAEIVEAAHSVEPHPEHGHNVHSTVSEITQNAFSLLIEDNTGLLLVDEAVKYAQGEHNRITDQRAVTYHNPQLVAEGAELAASAYRAVFPIAREMFPFSSEV
ncbi:MAG TPA: hypothetical protein VG965_00435 [Patescibacteria group bacterium]|nr:hypothetical protein [Patescibacteria group bacterium]